MDDYVLAIFKIRGYTNSDRTRAAFKAAGEDVDRTLSLLSWVKKRKELDQRELKRLETKEKRHEVVEQLKAIGYTDRAAFLALQSHGWNLEDAKSYLEAVDRKRKAKKKHPTAGIDNDDDNHDNDSAETANSEHAVEEKSSKVSEAPTDVPQSVLEHLERSTRVNRSTCRRVYIEEEGNLEKTSRKLNQIRENTKQKLQRSEEKCSERRRRRNDVQKLECLTGYPTEKCEKILAFFGYNYNKAEKQFLKFQNKKEEGKKIDIDVNETQLLTDFRIKELELSERRDLEQYFFSRDTLFDLVKILDQFDNPCCMVCPSIAHASHYLNREYTLLDIDDRFSYLPRYINYNLYQPAPLTQNFDMVLFDPPYFQIDMETLVNSVDVVTNYDTSTYLMVGFLRRSELQLLDGFMRYNLRPTRYHPGYAKVKPSKRKNYLMYSNWDGLPNNRDTI